MPDKLKAHARLAELAPEVSYAFSNFRIIDGQQWRLRTKFGDAPAGFFELRGHRTASGLLVCEEPIQRQILRFQPIFLGAIVMTRDFFAKTGRWDESLGRTASEDLEFTLRCVSYSPIGIIEAPLVGIRKHPGNFSSNLLRRLRGEIEILQYVADRHSLSPEVLETLREQITERSKEAAEVAFASGEPTVGRFPPPLDRFSRSVVLSLSRSIRRSR